MKNKKLFLASVLCVSAILAACNMQANEKSSSKAKPSKTTSSREVKKSKLTYNLNYEGAPEATSVDIEEGEIVKPIADPTREGRAFMGWCVDAAGSDFYVFGHELEEDTVVYAKWADAGLKKFVAEAEYCPCITEADDGKGMVGSTYSGGTQGKGLIQKETADMWADASNGHWVHFLYQPGADLIFEIKAEAACTANIYMRLSGEYLTPEFTVSSPNYKIKLNGNELTYSPVTFTNVPEQGTWLPFKDYVLSLNVSLQAGINKFDFITDNNILMKGTASGLAPMIDCLKFYTDGDLSWPTAKESQIISQDE